MTFYLVACRSRLCLWARTAFLVLIVGLVVGGQALAQTEPGQEPQRRGPDEAEPQGNETGEQSVVSGEAQTEGEDGEDEAGDESEQKEEPEPPPPRITFEVPLADGAGGGIARGAAGSLEYQPEDLVVASGGVELNYRDLKFQADRLTVNRDTMRVLGEGNVILDQGPRRLSGETVDFDLRTKTGTLSNADAYLEPDIYFSGEEITKIDEDSYTVKHGMVTSCEAEVPQWSFRMGQARIDVDKYARLKNTSMRVKKLPVLYMPYILWPAKRGRTSGLLVPNLGYSQQRGATVGLAYFQTMGDSYDATFFADTYEEDYLGLGLEFRYRPNEPTSGILSGYIIDDPVENETRWKVNWAHTSDNLPFGMRAVAQFNDFSDFNFFRDFERDFNNITIRRLQSSGFIAGNWGPQSFTLLLDQQETFFAGGDVVTQRQLPEAEYRLRPTQLGGLPLYLELLSSLHYLSTSRTGVLNEQYARADLFPKLSVPISPAPWLSASITGGARTTWYGDSIDATGTAFSGKSLTRFVPTAQFEAIGPSLSKIFEKGAGSFSKFKHVIEPRWNYLFADEFDDEALVPLFDEVDGVRPTNIVTFALVNRLLAKPEDEELYGGAREIFSFELSQAYSLDRDRPLQISPDGTMTARESPIGARFRFNPNRFVSVESQLAYNTLFNNLSSASLSGIVGFGTTNLGLTWYTRFEPVEGKTTTHQARISAGFDIVPNRLRLESQVNYDALLDFVQQQRHFLQYSGGCYGLRLEFSKLDTARRTDESIRLAISLKNVGTFLDMTGGRTDTF